MLIKDRVKELRRVQASTLRPSPRNWRTHPKAQREALQGVLAEIGYADALLAREVDGGLELIDGHLRAETTPDSIVPVLILDVTEAEAAKILATLDPLAAMAQADSDKLDALLRDVQTGSEAVTGMLSELAEKAGLAYGRPADDPSGGGDDFDAKPAEEGPTRTNLGELWVIGGVHRLLVGDCTDQENVARLLDGETPFLMVTDPPYGVEYQTTWRHESGIIDSARRGLVPNDDQSDWRAAWNLFPGSIAYVWHAGLRARQAVESLEACEFTIRAQIIWAKQQLVIGRGHYHFQHEPCWYAVRNGTTANWSGDRKQTTLWEIKNPLQSGEDPTVHGTQKPLECMARPIRNHGVAGDVVYDPFLGSGTTLIAAHRLGRRCYGLEIEPRYADVILARAEAEGLSIHKVT